jgi:RNA binding exosome subunit
VDELLVKSLHSLQESKSAKTDVDEEGHYGEQIAATLHRFTPRQKALAKMKIQRISF